MFSSLILPFTDIVGLFVDASDHCRVLHAHEDKYSRFQ